MKIFIITLLLLAAHLAMFAQNIVQAEYFFDIDKGVGNNTLISVTPSENSSFPFIANLAGVSQGYHTLFIRTKDANGKWSLTARKSIEVIFTAANTVTKGEYFFDADPGFGNAATINITAPDSLLLQNFTATLSGLAAGYHKMCLRMKDTNGNWSITSRYNVEVVKDVSGGRVFLVEYFFDTDPGFGNCASAVFATPAADGTFTFTIPKNNIPANALSLFLRVKDSSNLDWSLTAWKAFSTLPVTLLSFTAQKQNNSALLQWKTTNEVNTSYFNVQRSTEGAQYITVGKVTAKGNSALQNEYNYADNLSILPAGNIYYRLQTIDKDGKMSYSNIANVVIDENNTHIVIYPNPTHQFFFVENLNAENNVSITLKDMAGRTLMIRQATGKVKQKIDVSSLAKGMYVVAIITANGTETKKLVIQ